MSSNKSRQKIAARRLRSKLRKNKESLANDFEFKMFVIITFKNKVSYFSFQLNEFKNDVGNMR